MIINSNYVELFWTIFIPYKALYIQVLYIVNFKQCYLSNRGCRVFDARSECLET